MLFCEYYPIVQMSQNLLAACQVSFEALPMSIYIEALFVLNCQLTSYDILVYTAGPCNTMSFCSESFCYIVDEEKNISIPGFSHCMALSPWPLVTSHTPKVCPLGVMACLHSPSLRGSGCEWPFSGRVSCPEGLLPCPLSC